MYHVAVGVGARLEDAWVGRRVVQRIVAVLEAAACANGQIRRRPREGEIGVGQVAQRSRHLHRDRWLALTDAGEWQFHHHHLVAGAHAEISRVDGQRLAVRTHRQRVAGLAIGIEGQDMGGQRLPQVSGRDEGDTVIDLGTGAILASSWEEQIEERGVPRVGGNVGKGDVEGEGIAQQNVGAAGQGGSWASGQQAVISRHCGGGKSDGFVNITAVDFQRPVTTDTGAACVVAGRRHIRAGPARQFIDQGASGAACAHLAAVELDVGAFGEVLAPFAKGLGKLADVVGSQVGAAEGKFAGGTMGEDLDGVHVAKLGERGGYRGQAILAAVHHQRLDVGWQLGHQLLPVFDTAV